MSVSFGLLSCGCGGKGYTEEPYVFGMLVMYCYCRAEIAYKAERMKVLGWAGAA